MDTVLVHLLLVVAGVAVALAALHFYARVAGGLLSFAGLCLITFLVVATALVLAGFGVVAFPGIGA